MRKIVENGNFANAYRDGVFFARGRIRASIEPSRPPSERGQIVLYRHEKF
ncbi:MAG: hypothetical protein GY820_10755, partial [Gammaproteobacteria bacterium]|nr:hypothetical protein [Gammaproteobacteria bacterium]